MQTLLDGAAVFAGNLHDELLREILEWLTTRTDRFYVRQLMGHLRGRLNREIGTKEVYLRLAFLEELGWIRRKPLDVGWSWEILPPWECSVTIDLGEEAQRLSIFLRVDSSTRTSSRAASHRGHGPRRTS